jgi:3',5'-nucleoside bisphosphate phosphatase
MIDLHTHSNVSDGSDLPARIPELAKEAGCSAVALTDHDSLAGIGAARQRAAEVGVGFVAGCEVSCLSPGSGGMHVLVYFVDDEAGPLGDELGRLRHDRTRRNLALVDQLASLGIPITYDRVVALAGGEVGVGRPHFATALVELGVADSIDDAFARYLGNGRPGYVGKARLTGADVAKVAHNSGGVAVLAHPFSMGLIGGDLVRAVSDLADAGFAGIEVLYGRYSPRQRQALNHLAHRFDLVATGGSDYHGTIKPDLAVGTGRGDLKVADAVLDRLERRRPDR